MLDHEEKTDKERSAKKTEKESLSSLSGSDLTTQPSEPADVQRS